MQGILHKINGCATNNFLYSWHLKKIDQMWDIRKHNETSFLIYDGRFFKIEDEAYTILELLNTQNTIEEVSVLTGTSVDDINTLIEQLISLRKRPNKKKRKFLTLGLVLPDVIAKRIGGALSFLFSSSMAITAILILFIGSGVYILQCADRVYSMTQIGVIAYFISLLIISIIHELGHITAARRIRLEGNFNVYIGLYAVFFVFFVDDLNYLYFRDRKERLIVNIGGVYFQVLAFIPIALCVYLGIIPSLASALLWTNAILLVFNLFPFWATDGYWIISDYLANGNLNNECESIQRGLLRLDFTKRYSVTIWIYWVLRSLITIYLFMLWVKLIWRRLLQAPELYYVIIERPFELSTLIRVIIYLLPILIPAYYVFKRFR